MTESGSEREQRLARLGALRAAGHDPFQIERYDRSHVAQEIQDRYDALEGQTVRIAGRIPQPPRLMGKAAFFDLRDQSGRVQVYVRRDDLGEEAFEAFKDLDHGDLVGVEGTVFTTRSGEKTVHASSVTLLAKCLRPLPMGKEYEGGSAGSLSDVEQRYRMRYVDLIVNAEANRVLRQRSLVLREVRRFLDARGYLEVETPVLQTVAGGASARPFLTHHNALDYDFKLRISLELYLKRLIVGGFEKVYEIGRVFRNEGISPQHNPEFTLLELYEAYTNLEGMMDLVEEMYASVCQAVHGTTNLTVRVERGGVSEHTEIDFSRRPWKRLPILEGIRQYAGVESEELECLESAKRVCSRLGIPTEHEHTVGGIIEKLHEVYTQPNLVEPAFVTDFPIETSPLAKKSHDNPSLTRRFEVYVAQSELGNAFSEINDPIDQRERFEDQARQLAAGEAESHPFDEDFLRALEYGMPPTGGLGIGLDRLAMLMTGAETIKDVLLFPLLRPEA